MTLKQDITNTMSQSDLMRTLGWNSLKAFITTLIIIAGFIKLLELFGFYRYISVGQIALFTGIVMGIYYYYFWCGKGSIDMRFKNDKDYTFTWKDFFYTTKIDSDDHIMALAVSWVGGILVYGSMLLVIFIVKFCIDNSGSGQAMSMLRVVVIWMIATTFYLYTQRNNLKTNFWGTVTTCTAYGFALSLSAYFLGMIIGVSNMVLGVPITVAIVVLQIVFTSIYTYTSLLEWATKTHMVKVQTELPISDGAANQS